MEWTWPSAFAYVGIAWASAFAIWAIAKCFDGGFKK
jgi:hypothetical protein